MSFRSEMVKCQEVAAADELHLEIALMVAYGVGHRDEYNPATL